MLGEKDDLYIITHFLSSAGKRTDLDHEFGNILPCSKRRQTAIFTSCQTPHHT
jgi:hypothetical protein